MIREDGIQSGYRNVGRFFLWSIPLSLGGATCVWLGFAMASHDWLNTLSQEQRRAIYVGAEHRPKAKLRIEIPNGGELKIDRVDLEGSTASVYFHNSGTRGEVEFIQIAWTLISPDGTLLSHGWGYTGSLHGPSSLRPGEKGEAVFEGWLYGITTDSRAASIRFEITGSNYNR